MKSIADRIKFGANFDDQDYLSGNVPLYFAVSFGHTGILKLLIVDFKALDDATALTYTVSYKLKEMAEFLIEKGANVNSTCTNLKTPLHFALMLNHEEFVLLLLQNGASLNARDQDKITPIEEGLMSNQMTAFKTMIAYTQF